MFINVQIKSKNKASLKQYLELFYKISNSKVYLKTFNQQNSKKIYTILKSPHVNKTSQEQFECTLKKYKFNTKDLQSFMLLTILKKLQKTNGSDIILNITFITNNFHSQILQSKYLVPKKYRIKWYSSKLTKTYLRLIELHGNLKFNICLNSSVGRAKD